MDCNICLQKYNMESLTPRILPSCGHTLCEECGAKLLANGGRLTCPFDRVVSVVENGSIQNLPKNFAILELLESAPAPNPVPEDDDEISVEEYMYNLQFEASRDDALADIDPGILQEMFDPVVQDSEDDEIFLQECIYNLGLGAGNEESENVPESEEVQNNDVTLEKYIFTELIKCLRKLYDVLCTIFFRHSHSD